MARIRTIKPEFWTDETVVKLPFIARLLFIGMWNFADDSGALDYSPDRIKLQVLPAESDCDITDLIDLLAAAGLIDYWVTERGTEAITIRGWEKHQKIDNPSRKTIIREDYRKKSIPTEERVAVARKYGCQPGGSVDASCHYCGMPGKVHWWMGQNNKLSRWITLSELEFDYFVSEHSGGPAESGNIVLACRSCNRGKREFDPHQFFAIKNPSIALDRTIESSPLDQGSRKGSGEERKEIQGASPSGDALPAEPKSDPIPYLRIVTEFNRIMVNLPKVRDITANRKTAIRVAWQASESRQSVEFWTALFEEYADDPFLNGTGPYKPPHENWRPDFDHLLKPKVITKVYERAMDRLERAS